MNGHSGMTRAGRVGTIATVAGLALATAAGTASARELRFVVGNLETYTGFQPMVNFAKALKERAGVEAKVYSQSLLKFAETPGGLRDGIVDAGFVVTPYKPAEFSEVNLVANMSMLVTVGTPTENTGAAINGATMEYVLLNCPDCVSQFKAENQVYLAGGATTPYALNCNNTTVSSVEDVKGLKIRAGGANYGRWADYVGATTVSGTGNAAYEGLNQGVFACSMNAASEMIGQRYLDVTTSITLAMPGGSFSGIGHNNFNLSSWQGLTVEQRRAALDLSANLAADFVTAYVNQDQEALEKAKEKDGFEIVEASPELKALTEEFVNKDIETIKSDFVSKYGLSDVDAKVAKFEELLEKWKGLVNGAGGDADALAEIYLSEIFSKVDAETYGMN